MKPTIAAALGLATLLALAPMQSAFGQEATAPQGPAETPAPAEEEALSPNPFLPGEQTIALGAGVYLPIFILPDTREIVESKLDLGGVFSFSYQYFIARGLAISGTIGGGFNGTIGGRSLFVAPLSFRTAYWWAILPFEFNVGAELGGYLLRLGDYGMIGPFAKVGGGALWRSASSWSLGLQASFWLVPEIHTGSYSDLTRTGGFTEISALAVYHL